MLQIPNTITVLRILLVPGRLAPWNGQLILHAVARTLLDERVRDGARDLRVGDEVVVLTWLDAGDRDTLMVHPRDDPAAPLTGVFSTRSADRPNPIGLHRVRIESVAATRFEVSDLEAIDGTPILDVKPVLDRRLEK